MTLRLRSPGKPGRARPLEVRHVHKVYRTLYQRQTFPTPRLLLDGGRYVVRAAVARPPRLLLGVFKPGASRTEGIVYLPREHWVVDAVTGRVILKLGELDKYNVAARHLLIRKRATDEVMELISLADGARIKPRVKLPGKVTVKRGPSVWANWRSPDIWVFATGTDGRTYYGPWDHPSPEPLALTRWLPFFPAQMDHDSGSGTLQVWDRSHSGPCVYARLHRRGRPTCLLKDPQKTYSASRLGDPSWTWLKDSWVLHATEVDPPHIGVRGVDGERLALDLAAGKVHVMKPTTCRLDGHGMADRMLRSPPRALWRCIGQKETTFYLWSPGEIRRWRPNQSWLSFRFLLRLLDPSSIPVHRPVLALVGHPDRTLGWLDLEHRRVIMAPGLRAAAWSAPDYPLAARHLAAGQKQVVRLDRETSTVRAIATIDDCPKGRLLLGEFHGDLVAVSCKARRGSAYTFDVRWSELLDIKRKVRWRVPGVVEKVLPGGKVIVSNRQREGAESWYPVSRLWVVDVGGPIKVKPKPCHEAPACARYGRCVARKGACVVSSHQQCARSTVACRAWGECSARGGRCVATDDASCQRSSGCKEHGRCAARGGVCVAASNAHCLRSGGCKGQGRCAAKDGRCVATSDAHCAAAAVCKEGHCQATDDGRCYNHCIGTNNCDRWGLCTARGDNCVATSDADCGRSGECKMHGGCKAVRGQCRVGSDDDCRRSSVECKDLGQCVKDSSGQCSAANDASCRVAQRCKSEGWCAEMRGRCVAGSNGRCRRSDACKKEGRCATKDRACVAASHGHCRRSDACRREGRCAVKKGVCVAASSRDCRRSHQCKTRGLCTAREDRCIAVNDTECEGAVACKERGKCMAYKGQCTRRCRDLPGCKRWGRCTDRGQNCLPTGSDCRGSTISCKYLGRCTAQKGACVATSDAHCRASERCAVAGECAAAKGKCVVSSAADCGKAWVCKTMGWCTLRAGRCSAKT